MHSSPSCVCTSLRKATRAVSRVYDEAIAASGLTTTQLAVLRTLRREGPLPLSRLAELLVMDRTSLYRTLTPIEREGWIAIETEGRGRARVAILSDAGVAAMSRADAGWEAAQARFIGALGKQNWAQLEAALRRVTGIAMEGGA